MSRIRSDRQQQYKYMTQEEQQNALKQQIEEKKRQKIIEELQNKQEILQHYKNYQLGADEHAGENPNHMKDLQSLVIQKEKELENYQMILGIQGGGVLGGARGNEVFKGDMNQFQKGNLNDLSAAQSNFAQRQMDLFDDKFVANYNQNQAKNNENMNIINSIFGGGNQPSHQLTQESERERRLKLREMERQKRNQGFDGGIYGQIQQDVPNNIPTKQTPSSQQNIFGEGEVVSKRDQVWQQKMQRRVESADRGHRAPVSVHNQLPIYSNEHAQNNHPHSNDHHAFAMENNLRNSRVGLQISEARKLDQSINHQEENQEKNNAMSVGIIPTGDNELN